ncbi:MAG: hypothetical protein R2880_11615 [Deinococcales bacterium]
MMVRFEVVDEVRKECDELLASIEEVALLQGLFQLSLTVQSLGSFLLRVKEGISSC